MALCGTNGVNHTKHNRFIRPDLPLNWGLTNRSVKYFRAPLSSNSIATTAFDVLQDCLLTSLSSPNHSIVFTAAARERSKVGLGFVDCGPHVSAAVVCMLACCPFMGVCVHLVLPFVAQKAAFVGRVV